MVTELGLLLSGPTQGTRRYYARVNVMRAGGLQLSRAHCNTYCRYLFSHEDTPGHVEIIEISPQVAKLAKFCRVCCKLAKKVPRLPQAST